VLNNVADNYFNLSGKLMNGSYLQILKDAITTSLKILSWDLRGETEENYDKIGNVFII
jgi:hypothetical protein